MNRQGNFMKRRLVACLIILSLCFSALGLRLFYVSNNDEYASIQSATRVKDIDKKRGNIYDSNMNLLATTNTEWRIFISTRDIKKAEKESGTKYSVTIAEGLAAILELDPVSLLEKIQKTNQLDVTIKKSTDESEYREVLDFININ